MGDTFGPAPKSKIPIPFVLKREDMFFIDAADEGLDFGVIMLSSYYVGLLAANGSVALAEKNWIHQHKIRFDGYLMLGLPVEYTSDRVNDDGEGTVSATLISVARLEKLPEGVAETRHPRFVGQLGANFPLQSVCGMSGGPILGFNFEEPVRYWIVALQSTWLRDRRLVLPPSNFGVVDDRLGESRIGRSARPLPVPYPLVLRNHIMAKRNLSAREGLRRERKYDGERYAWFSLQERASADGVVE